MEKQFRSNSSLLVLNHLPKIFNMMHILNMMVYGFVASQPVFFISAISSLQKTIRIPKIRFGKRLGKPLFLRLRNFYHGVLATSLLLVLFVSRSTVSLLFIVACLAMLGLATQLLIINKRTIMENRVLDRRNSQIHRAQVKNYVGRWYYHYQRYRITDLLTFLAILLTVFC